MKILMISIDKGLLGRGQLGDVLDRHKKYGEHCERLDIIVLSSVGYENYQLSNKVTAYPTNSKKKWQYYYDAMKIGKELFGRYKYDLIVTQEPFITGLIGCQLKKKFGTKLLIHFHGDFWQNSLWLRESKKNIFYNILQKIIVPRADAIRVTSHIIKDKLIKSGLNEKKIRVINPLYSNSSKKYGRILFLYKTETVKKYKNMAAIERI